MFSKFSVDSAVVDHSHSATFVDSFYAVLLQNTPNGPLLHMWILTLSSTEQPLAPALQQQPTLRRRMHVASKKVS